MLKSAPIEPTWLAKCVSTVPLAAAIVLFWGAERKASGTLKRITERDVSATGHTTLKIIAILLSLTAIGTSYILWLL